MRRTIVLLISFVILSGSTDFHCGEAPSSKKGSKSNSQKMALGEIKKGTLTKTTTISGHVKSERTLELKPTYSAYIRKIYVKTGSVVRKGDPLVLISESIATPGNQIYPIRAPFSGTVTFVHRKEGEFIEKGSSSENDPILRLDDLTSLYIKGEIPEVDMNSLKTKLNAEISLNAIPFQSFKGTVASIALAAATSEHRWDNKSATYPVIISLDEKSELIRPGMSAVVQIKTKEKSDVLLIQQRYVGKDEEGYFARDENGEKKYLKLGDYNDKYYEIISGIDEGDKVSQIDFTRDFLAN